MKVETFTIGVLCNFLHIYTNAHVWVVFCQNAVESAVSACGLSFATYTVHVPSYLQMNSVKPLKKKMVAPRREVQKNTRVVEVQFSFQKLKDFHSQGISFR